MIEPSRRSIITGLITLIAAPAIVRVGSLMPIKQMGDSFTSVEIGGPTEFRYGWCVHILGCGDQTISSVTIGDVDAVQIERGFWVLPH